MNLYNNTTLLLFTQPHIGFLDTNEGTDIPHKGLADTTSIHLAKIRVIFTLQAHFLILHVLVLTISPGNAHTVHTRVSLKPNHHVG